MSVIGSSAGPDCLRSWVQHRLMSARTIRPEAPRPWGRQSQLESAWCCVQTPAAFANFRAPFDENINTSVSASVSSARTSRTWSTVAATPRAGIAKRRATSTRSLRLQYQTRPRRSFAATGCPLSATRTRPGARRPEPASPDSTLDPRDGYTSARNFRRPGGLSRTGASFRRIPATRFQPLAERRVFKETCWWPARARRLARASREDITEARPFRTGGGIRSGGYPYQSLGVPGAAMRSLAAGYLPW